MGKSSLDSIQLSFSTPDSFSNEVTVFRVLLDNSTEPIGKVYPDLSKGEDSLIYVCTNNQGIQIFPPSVDFIEIEERFRKYAGELSQKSFTENMKTEAETFIEREESIKHLRRTKARNRELNILLNNI
jgi:hypothetical protein